MKLYSYYQSSASYRVRIALNLKGLKPEMQYINLVKDEQRDPAYAAVNTQMVVPTLIDNNQKLSQSLAIMEYLEEAYPTPALLPKNMFARTYVRGLALLVACDISPFGNLKVRKFLEAQYGKDKEAQEAWSRHWIEDGFNAFEKILTTSGHMGKFCYQDTPTLADCCLVPQMFNAQRFKCNLGAYPNIVRIYEECGKHPAFIAAHPSKQADAD